MLDRAKVFLAGLALIGIALVGGSFLAKPKLAHFDATTGRTARWELTGEEWTGGPPQNYLTRFKVALNIMWNHTGRVGPGGAFRIESQVEVPYVKVLAWKYRGEPETMAVVEDPLGDLTEPTYTVIFENARNAVHYLFAERLQLSLHLAGIEVEPDQAAQVSPAGRTSWSLSATKPGTYLGFIRANLRPAPKIEGHPGKVGSIPPFVQVVDKSLEDVPVQLVVRQDTAQRVMFFAARALGLCLLLVAFYYFLRGRRYQSKISVSQDSVEIWQERLDFLIQELGKASDATVKFQLQQEVEGAQKMLARLRRNE